MKVVLCGTIVPPQFETKIKDLSNAGNRFLLNVHRELSKTDDVEVVSYIAVKTDNEVKEELLDGNQWNYTFKSKGIVGSLIAYQKKIRKYLRVSDCLITYNVFYPWMGAILTARRLKKKSILILADYSPEESYSGIKKRLYARAQSFLMKKYDVIVGLSSNTRKYIPDNHKFVCIQGGISEEFYREFDRTGEINSTRPDEQVRNYEDHGITIMYAGLLSKVTGVDLLVEAFENLKRISSCRLVISGKGELSEYIREKAQNDELIEYLGLMQYEEYVDKLKDADILINPRNMTLLENMNNFPSKVMEYLATGKPIVSTKFPGHEQFANNIFFSDSDSKSLTETLYKAIKVYDKEKQKIYENNRKFSRKFLWKTQCDKLRGAIKEDA